jgi:hypothetical protein
MPLFYMTTYYILSIQEIITHYADIFVNAAIDSWISTWAGMN